MKIDGVSAIALVLIASFAIDRLVSGAMFLLTLAHIVRDPSATTDPELRVSVERWNKVWYHALAGVLAIGVMAYMGRVQLLRALLPGIEDTSNSSFFSFLDIVVTGLVLMGGAERISALLKGLPPEKASTPAPPIEVRGKLTLEEGGVARAATSSR